MPDLSIIIVSWNARSYLAGCLRSIEACSDGLLIETIVVDNDSSDGSPQMVETEFPSVRLVRAGGNLGFARANNVGIREARGRYLYLINSDVVIRPGCLRATYEFMESHPEVGLCAPRILNPDGSLQVSCRYFPSLWNSLCAALCLPLLFPNSELFSDWFMRAWPHDCCREVDVLSGCFWVARADATKQVGLLDQQFFIYGEDVDWCRRFHLSGWKVMFVPSGEAIHFGGASSANAPLRFHLEMQKANLQYWRKHHGLGPAAAYQAIVFLRHALRLAVRGGAYVIQPARRLDLKSQMHTHLATLRWIVGVPSRV